MLCASEIVFEYFLLCCWGYYFIIELEPLVLNFNERVVMTTAAFRSIMNHNTIQLVIGRGMLFEEWSKIYGRRV